MIDFELTADEIATLDRALEAAETEIENETESAHELDEPATAATSPAEVAYQVRVIDAALCAIDRADLDPAELALPELLAARDRALGR